LQPTEGVRLLASRQSGGRAPALALSRRLRTLGSQRVLLSTVMKSSGRADAVINGGLNTV